MATSTKRRRLIVFSLLGIVLAGLTAGAVLRKREPIITIQTEKVTRRNLIEIVSANGRIQPVLQVKISPEVSGEIIELPVKEGQCVQQGSLILKIKPDYYIAARNQSEASYKTSLAGLARAEADLRKATAEFKRNEDLYRAKLISESVFDEFQAAFDIAEAQVNSAGHQVEMTRASLANAEVELAKTTIVSPLTGTVSRLDSRVGERVVGTATMAGTEVMVLADLNEMEARVDIGEMDVVLIQPGQNVRLEVDAFKDRKFTGTVTEIANSSKTALQGGSLGGGSQEATKFEVKIRVKEKDAFRPGMSVTAEIETRSRTNVLTVPFASVTTRVPKEKENPKPGWARKTAAKGSATNSAAAGTNASPVSSGELVSATNTAAGDTNTANSDKKAKEAAKPVEVVFVVEKDRAKMVKVKSGIYDDSYYEIVEGLQEGQEIVSGGFRAIGKELEDGKKIRKGPPPGDKEKEAEQSKGG
jgi:HlyD family secretion protein